MQALATAAARALAIGDALGALRLVALHDDPTALALRGIAMAQLGEHGRARELLRRAARGFGPRAAVARARCVVAEAEIALAVRDLGGSTRPLLAALATLQAQGDLANALLARLVAVRRALLLGRLAEAAQALAPLQPAPAMPARLRAVAELCAAELDLRALRTGPARAALARAQAAAAQAGVPALQAEVQAARTALEQPAARRVDQGRDAPLALDAVASLLASGALVADGCRRGLQCGPHWIALARRPVLFTLAHALAQAWPGAAERAALIATAFRIRQPDETHRARLRVELGRLRALLRGHALVEATATGYALRPAAGRAVAVLAPPIAGEQAALLALLSDGAAWSTSALGLALDASQRTVQRALVELAAQGRVRAIGQARARRWLAPPLAGFTTVLLLPTALPPG
ncbi:helix-turn-helix domain-containing protein [Pseudorhodoferax sp. LjRoot39]|uniref:helix-turn-helix domain-containing protein n=1 Tax=Pseudorhodoferax sp. LjRoot39 TaxID=3342328 RepID=UPI003ECDA1B7